MIPTANPKLRLGQAVAFYCPIVGRDRTGTISKIYPPTDRSHALAVAVRIVSEAGSDYHDRLVTADRLVLASHRQPVSGSQAAEGGAA